MLINITPILKPILLGSLVVTLSMGAYASDRISTDLSGRGIMIEPDGFVSGAASVQESPLSDYFDAGCSLYGVDDYLLNDSYFFCIDNSGFKFNFWIEKGDYEGLDYNGSRLFASGGDDASPIEFVGDILEIAVLPDCGVDFGGIYSLGPVMVGAQAMKEVSGIAFSDDENMFGWAQEAGLFSVSVNDLSQGTLLLGQAHQEVEDIEVVTIDGQQCVVGLLNNNDEGTKDTNAVVDIDGVIKANYVVACPPEDDSDSWTFSAPCHAQVEEALRGNYASEIEAIEVLPRLSLDDSLKILLGFHTNSDFLPAEGNPPPGVGPNNTLVLGVLEVSSCTLSTQMVYETPFNEFGDGLDVEGLAMVCPKPEED